MKPLRCQFFEAAPKQWLYAVETPDTRTMKACNSGLWDWREFAILEGPFPSVEKAKEVQRKNHPEAEVLTVREYNADEIKKISHLLLIKIGQLLPKEQTNGTV